LFSGAFLASFCLFCFGLLDFVDCLEFLFCFGCNALVIVATAFMTYTKSFTAFYFPGGSGSFFFFGGLSLASFSFGFF
jgi:hypothetical protein